MHTWAYSRIWLFILSIHNWLHLLIPNSHSIPPCPLPLCSSEASRGTRVLSETLPGLLAWKLGPSFDGKDLATSSK